MNPIRHFKFKCRSLAFLLLVAGFSIQSGIAIAKTDKHPDNPRMLNSSSPYLKIHASDLVQWYEWGDEAFELARKQGKPLMVSFGYTACHWCHVMQETHFTVPDIAKAINDNFIPVVVDRERRPVLDETYMLVTEVLTKRGGWPNTVFITADRKPFYGTGYISADDFRKIITAITESWADENAGVQAEAARLSNVLQKHLNRRKAAKELSDELMSQSATDLANEFDEFVGGFGGAPKFFQQSILMFLLQQAERKNNEEALAAVELTLQSVISGGIHDQIEGGLHRYAIDPAWRIPHFEKMLYDQAMMSEAFVEAWRITGKSEYRSMARRIIDYVLNDLTAPEGGFYSTRDADSEGEEGTYYLWTEVQLTDALGAKEAQYAIEIFEQVPDGDLVGKVILNRDLINDEINPRAEKIFSRLAKVRASRIKPQRDEKIIVSWNGMMIGALAQAAIVLNDDAYAAAASRAGNFIWDNLHRKDGTLLRSYYRGKAELEAQLVDYVWLGRAYIKLYDLTDRPVWLERARSLLVEMEKEFVDEEQGDFYSSRGADGFGRSKSREDSDLASGNGAALDLIVAINTRIGSPELQRRSEKLISALSGFAASNPASGASTLAAADRYFNGGFGPVQYGGNGNVRASARLENGQILVNLRVAPGWHVNANKPLEDYLIPTSLTAGTAPKVVYPKPKIVRLGFSKNPLALLDGEVEITAVAENSDGPTRFELEIQACSDKICLAPDTLKFVLSPANPAK